MKLLLQPDELSHAVKNYLRDTYSLYGEVEVQELHEVEVEIKPRNYESLNASTNDYGAASKSEYTSSVPNDIEYDTTREDAIGRADHLGIKYRVDISTEKLIERIQEHEETISLIAQESEGLIKYVEDGNELPFDNAVDDVVESDEPVEELSDETIQEVQEEQTQKKKKSIFDKSE